MDIPYLKTAVGFLAIFLQSFFAYQIHLAYLEPDYVRIQNPEITQLVFDDLSGSERVYKVDSDQNFELDITILKPESNNLEQVYTAEVFNNQNEKLFGFTVQPSDWQEDYDQFLREYFLRGSGLKQQLSAGDYEIHVFSSSFLPEEKGNSGQYILKIGSKKNTNVASLVNLYWQVPMLKLSFLRTSPLEILFTPIGISLIALLGVFLIISTVFSTVISSVKKRIKQDKAKTLLLTSAGMVMKDEIAKLLQKPAYDINIAFINTAAKDGNQEYVQKDLEIMKEMRFNVQEIDIEGKKEFEVAKLLESKDIIYVEGGNTFRLLKAMKNCNFEKIIRNLLGQGKVYLGVSAGSVVAGKTIKTASWEHGDENTVGLKDLKGLNLVPFDVYVHFKAGDEEIIKKNIKSERDRKKNIRIITDEQAILVQGGETIVIGAGEKVIV